MPTWGAESPEEAERVFRLLEQLTSAPDAEKRREAARLLLEEKEESVRKEIMEVWQKERILEGKVSPIIGSGLVGFLDFGPLVGRPGDEQQETSSKARKTMILRYTPRGIWLIEDSPTLVRSCEQLDHLFAPDAARLAELDGQQGEEQAFANDFIRQVYEREELVPGKVYEQTVEWLEF